MKRYTFRLASVARVRGIERDQAVGALAQARIALEESRVRTADRQAAYRELVGLPIGPTIEDLRGRRRQQELAADAVSRAQQAEHLAEQVVAARLDDWAAADRRVRLLEQLDERSRERHAAEVLAEDQQVLDDLVTSRRRRAS